MSARVVESSVSTCSRSAATSASLSSRYFRSYGMISQVQESSYIVTYSRNAVNAGAKDVDL